MIYEILKNLTQKGYKISFEDSFNGTIRLTLSKIIKGQLFRCESRASFEMMESVTLTEDEMIKVLLEQTEKRFDNDSNSVMASH